MRRQVTTEEIESVDRVMEAIGVVLVVAPPRIPAKLGLRLCDAVPEISPKLAER